MTGSRDEAAADPCQRGNVAADRSLVIAYLVNRYPDTSLTFIRREIRAQEQRGVRVHLHTVRTPPDDLVDPLDQEEAARVHIILRAGAVRLCWDTIRLGVSRPLRMAKALKETLAQAVRARGRLIAHLAYLVEASHLVRRLAEHPVDILHAHFGTNPASVAVLTRLLGGPPVVITMHGPEEFERPVHFSLAAKVSRADATVCVSESGASFLRTICRPVDAARLHVVHCGIDEEALQRPRLPLPVEPRVVCVGRMCKQKNHMLLLAAVRELIDRGLPVSLVLVGDGPLRTRLERYVEQHQLSANVTLTGWLSGPEVTAQIESARLVALSSEAEGLPVVLMEAFAAYRPVVATAVCGVPELVDPANGWLAPPDDMPALATALENALTADDEVLALMGTRGHDRVAADFNMATEAAKLRGIYRRILDGMDRPL